jgi:hypothetical protein
VHSCEIVSVKGFLARSQRALSKRRNKRAACVGRLFFFAHTQKAFRLAPHTSTLLHPPQTNRELQKQATFHQRHRATAPTQWRDG